MIILSIHSGHNSTVGLMQDGKVLGLLSQEKIDNIKNSADFPSGAIDALLDQCSITRDEIDEIAIADLAIYPKHCYDFLFEDQNQPESSLVRIARETERSVFGKVFPGIFTAARYFRRKSMEAEGRQFLALKLAEAGLSAKPVTHIEHHTCHARSAYHGLCRDDEPALIFTADGSGDQLSATVTVAGGGRWERIAATPVDSSLGGIYSNATRFLGMKILEDEHKVMGLAAYCKGGQEDVYQRIFAPVVGFDPKNPLNFRATMDSPRFYDYLVKNAVGERFDNIAGAVQKLLEERITAWIREGIRKTGIRNIFTSGGVFMNVKLNRRVQQMEELDRVHFLPSCGDESNPIGAAYALTVARGGKTEPLDNLYLGVSYSKQLLQQLVHSRGLQEKYAVTEPVDIEEAIAELLANREVVARFSGRCEWGARSLGNRAILAHPSHLESFFTVNDLIKQRDFWMPFAPSILDEAAHLYLDDYNPARVESPHMITAFRATRLGVTHLRAAMHQADSTIRPQVLTPSDNPEYYRMIKAFERRTGVSAVLNTSLNLHGHPLAATLEQALATFKNSGLQYLALGSFLISKYK